MQFVILVVDSTDRERLVITKEELYRMLAHEVSRPDLPLFFCFCFMSIRPSFPGPAQSGRADLRQQAGHEGLHVGGRDLKVHDAECH